MKKIFMIISLLISVISFSFVDGQYSVKKNNGNTIAVMKMICKNGKILYVSFDEQYSSGKSVKLEDKSFANQEMRVSSHVVMRNSIDNINIDFKNSAYSNDFKQFYKFLENKAKNGEKGDFTI